MTGPAGDGTGKELQPVLRVGAAVERTLDRGGGGVTRGRRQDGEILQQVGTAVAVEGVVGGHAVVRRIGSGPNEIDAQASRGAEESVVEDGVAENRIAAVLRNDCEGPRRRSRWGIRQSTRRVGDISIHRHGPGSSQGSAVRQAGTGIQSDARLRKNVSFEGGADADRRGTADLPVDVVSRAVEQDHRRTDSGCGRDRTSDLEHEARVRVALSVECECTCQRSRRAETIDARQERLPTQVRAGQIRERREACEVNVRTGEIPLSLRCDRIGGMGRTGVRDQVRAGDRSPGADA